MNEVVTWARIAAKNVLNIDEAAMYIGVAVGTMYNIANCHSLHYSKNRGRLFFKKSDIDEWLMSSPVPSVKELQATAAKYLTKR